MNTIPIGNGVQCPNRRMLRYDDMAYCELHPHYCLLDTDGKCEIFNDYLKEVKSEAKITGV